MHHGTAPGSPPTFADFERQWANLATAWRAQSPTEPNHHRDLTSFCRLLDDAIERAARGVNEQPVSFPCLPTEVLAGILSAFSHAGSELQRLAALPRSVAPPQDVVDDAHTVFAAVAKVLRVDSQSRIKALSDGLESMLRGVRDSTETLLRVVLAVEDSLARNQSPIEIEKNASPTDSAPLQLSPLQRSMLQVTADVLNLQTVIYDTSSNADGAILTAADWSLDIVRLSRSARAHEHPRTPTKTSGRAERTSGATPRPTPYHLHSHARFRCMLQPSLVYSVATEAAASGNGAPHRNSQRLRLLNAQQASQALRFVGTTFRAVSLWMRTNLVHTSSERPTHTVNARAVAPSSDARSSGAGDEGDDRRRAVERTRVLDQVTGDLSTTVFVALTHNLGTMISFCAVHAGSRHLLDEMLFPFEGQGNATLHSPPSTLHENRPLVVEVSEFWHQCCRIGGASKRPQYCGPATAERMLLVGCSLLCALQQSVPAWIVRAVRAARSSTASVASTASSGGSILRDHRYSFVSVLCRIIATIPLMIHRRTALTVGAGRGLGGGVLDENANDRVTFALRVLRPSAFNCAPLMTPEHIVESHSSGEGSSYRPLRGLWGFELGRIHRSQQPGHGSSSSLDSAATSSTGGAASANAGDTHLPDPVEISLWHLAFDCLFALVRSVDVVRMRGCPF